MITESMLLDSPVETRRAWILWLERLVRPPLEFLASGQGDEDLAIEMHPSATHRKEMARLELLGRILNGIAPWLEAPEVPPEERALQDEFRRIARTAIEKAVDPASPARANFDQGKQPLVDAAFLCQAMLRAPVELWGKLTGDVQSRVVDRLLSTRRIPPAFNNWLLFSAMVERFFAFTGENWDRMRVDYAVRQHLQWYLGGGVYGDGPDFAEDYYNSFVIQPFLLDLTSTDDFRERAGDAASTAIRSRAIRYACLLEQRVNPDGSFPALGRSICYRAGAFHLLAQVAWQKALPSALSPSQVRSALTAVLARCLEAPGTFDQRGWLQIGLCGSQPGLGEVYITTASLYLTTFALLPLGLSPEDEFWSSDAEAWTSLRLWTGQDFGRPTVALEKRGGLERGEFRK